MKRLDLKNAKEQIDSYINGNRIDFATYISKLNQVQVMELCLALQAYFSQAAYKGILDYLITSLED